MENIITFLKVREHEEPTKVFGYVDGGKFILKRYIEEDNCISFIFWDDHNPQKGLLDHVNGFFAKPGLKQHTYIDAKEWESNIGKFYPRIYRRGLDYKEGQALTYSKIMILLP